MTDNEFFEETGMTKAEARARLAGLRKIVDSYYSQLFAAGAGSFFHAFVEWCGVMKEHLNIVEKLIDNGHNPFGDNVHSGKNLPIPEYQLAYLTEKMDCIFNGIIEVSVKPAPRGIPLQAAVTSFELRPGDPGFFAMSDEAIKLLYGFLACG